MARKTFKPDFADLPSERSVELGDPTLAMHYNQKTGRPIRKSAGRKTLNPGYLDPEKVIEDDSTDHFENDDEVGPEEVVKVKKRRSKKRKRTPSPTPPRLTPEPLCDIRTPKMSPSPDEGSTESQPSDMSGTLSIVANIPLGFSGPLHIKVDVSDLLDGTKKRRYVEGLKGDFGAARGVLSKSANTKKCGFLKLPAELRNQIYRILFLSKAPLDLRGDHLCRSGALLSTCRQVYDEARNILYGENCFLIERDKSSRRPMWQRDSREIGYKHFRLWLSNMSPITISMIRSIELELDDALPSQTPELRNNEERRYIHDGHLLEALKLLGQNGKLKKIRLTFAGRRSLARTDHRFLKHLCMIKVDEINKGESFTRFPYPYHRIHESVMNHIRREMLRKTPLYESEDVQESHR